MKKFIAIILSMVILSNLTVGFAFAKEPTTSVINETEKKTDEHIKNVAQKSKKLSIREKKIDSLKQKIEKNNKPILNEIKKIENMSDKEYKTNLFHKRLKTFGVMALAICCVGIFKDKVLFSLNWLRGFIGGLLIPDVIFQLITGNADYAEIYQRGFKDGNALHVDNSFLDSLKKFKSVAYNLINPSNIKPLNKSEVTKLSSALNSLLDSCPKKI